MNHLGRRDFLAAAGSALVLSSARPGPARANQAPTAGGVRCIEPDRASGTSQAVVVDPAPLAHTSQLLPLDAQGRIVGNGRPAVQVEKALENLGLALAEARSSLDRSVKLNVYVTRPETVPVVQKALASKFAGEVRPAVCFVSGTLAHPDALVAMDAVAVTAQAPGDAVALSRCASLPGLRDGSHVAVLPAGGRVYIAGQAEKGDLAQATRQTMESLRRTLKFLGLKDADIVQVKSFMHPITQIDVVEREMAAFFGKQRMPPQVYVEWSSALPIEIELIAHAGPAKEKADVIEYLTPPGMTASPIYSRVARVNHGPTIFLSGLYGPAAKTGEEQIEAIIRQLGGLLKKTGSDMRHMAKATYYVSTEDASRKLNEIRPKHYDPKRPPAASKAMVAGVGVEGKTITIDMIAVPTPASRRNG